MWKGRRPQVQKVNMVGELAGGRMHGQLDKVRQFA